MLSAVLAHVGSDATGQTFSVAWLLSANAEPVTTRHRHRLGRESQLCRPSTIPPDEISLSPTSTRKISVSSALNLDWLPDRER